MKADRYAVACNVTTADAVVATGASAWLTHETDPGWGHERPVVLVRSRSGRLVQRRMASTRLRDFRVKTIPPEHPRYDDDRIVHETRDSAERLAVALERTAPS